jgi:transcriptional regulator with XRE-family HTH domain
MTERLARALGDELRRARNRQGWTRKDLQARLGQDVALQTLATYELGTRPLSVARLIELAGALDVSVLEILSRTLGRVGDVDQISRLEIDIRAVAGDRTAELAPLRRWAAACLRHALPGEPTLAQLDQPAIVRLAEICGLGVEELTAKLWSIASRYTA